MTSRPLAAINDTLCKLAIAKEENVRQLTVLAHTVSAFTGALRFGSCRLQSEDCRVYASTIHVPPQHITRFRSCGLPARPYVLHPYNQSNPLHPYDHP
jgi:hypothetical protein